MSRWTAGAFRARASPGVLVGARALGGPAISARARAFLSSTAVLSPRLTIPTVRPLLPSSSPSLSSQCSDELQLKTWGWDRWGSVRVRSLPACLPAYLSGCARLTITSSHAHVPLTPTGAQSDGHTRVRAPKPRAPSSVRRRQKLLLLKSRVRSLDVVAYFKTKHEHHPSRLCPVGLCVEWGGVAVRRYSALLLRSAIGCARNKV